MKIDLHGYHIHEGWRQFQRQVNDAYFAGHKRCVVVTGQGAMMNEFKTWANNHPRIRECTQNPHNPGSFSIKLKKKG